MVRQVDNIPPVKGIYSDLMENEMWLVSYTTWLNSTLGSKTELITPGNMLLLTTGTIVMGRLATNRAALVPESTDNKSATVPTQRREVVTPPQPPPPDKQQSYRDEVLSIVNSYNMVDEHSDYTVLQ